MQGRSISRICVWWVGEIEYFIKHPLEAHAQYTELLMDVARHFPGHLVRRGGRGRNIYTVPRAGPSLWRFFFLMRGALYFGWKTKEAQALLPTGTTPGVVCVGIYQSVFPMAAAIWPLAP